MNKRFSFFLIGVINICEGVLGLILGKIFIRRWHNVDKFESIIWIFSGILFLYVSKKIKKPEKYSKCPRCKESFNYNELEKGKCKYCKDIETIELEEYYKKYPEELKEE